MADLFDHLRLRYPIWSAGMGLGISGADLAAAVSDAGGCGVLGAGGMPGEQVTQLIERYRALTSKPCGVNIILPMSDGTDISACFDARVPLMVLFWGDPQPFVADAHRRGAKLVCQCGSAEEAAAAAAAGVDAVIVQGIEAGGHVKALAPLEETVGSSVRELGSIPVIAAGGLATGSDIAAALKMGASAVSLGTRFVASREAQVRDDYKNRIVTAGAADTVLTKLFDVGWPDATHRVIRNAAYNNWEQAGKPPSGDRPGERDTIAYVQSGELPRYTVCPPVIDLDGDLGDVPLYAGESCEHIKEVSSAADIMRSLIEELHATS